MLPGGGDIGDDDPARTLLAASAAVDDLLSDAAPLRSKTGIWTMLSPLDSLHPSSPSTVPPSAPPPSAGIATLERDAEAPRRAEFGEGGRGVRASERARS